MLSRSSTLVSDVRSLPLNKRMSLALTDLDRGGGRMLADSGGGASSSSSGRFDKTLLAAAIRVSLPSLEAISGSDSSVDGALFVLKTVVSGAGAMQLLTFACGRNDSVLASAHRALPIVYHAAAAAGHRHVARYLLKGTSASADVEARLCEAIGSKFFVSVMLGTLPALAVLLSLFCKFRSLMTGEGCTFSMDDIAADEGLISAFLVFLSNGFAAFGIDASALLLFSGQLAEICASLPRHQALRLRSNVLQQTLSDSFASFQVAWSIYTSSPTGDSDRLRPPPSLTLVKVPMDLAASAVAQLVFQRHLINFGGTLLDPVTALSPEPVAKRPKAGLSQTQPSALLAAGNGGGKGKGKGKGGRAVGLAPALSIGGRGGGNAVGSNPSELGAQRDRTFGCKVEGDKATWGAATYNLATARADFVSQFPAIPNPDPVALCCEATSEVGYIRKLDPATSPSDVAAYIFWWRSWSIRKHRPDFA